MTKANYSLRLQPSLKKAAERLALADGTSLNQFINVAVAEKLSALETEAFFQTRAAKGNRGAFLSFLDEAGDEPPGEGDVVDDYRR
ncbi:MAG TPA: toxin-antitoxin system HicB family antitoxin [Stellaceae bacterium]|nr:toxin-antitoxin system HicB family antitoxin [Stellaceae bacterium]